MTASKRKNENVDCVANQLTKMVIVGDNDEKENNGTNQDPPAPATVLMTTMERMINLSVQCEQEGLVGSIIGSNIDETKSYDDAFAQAIGSIIDDNNSDIELENSLLEQAGEIKSHLSNEIQQAKGLHRKETDVIWDLSENLTKFQEQRHNLLREIDELDDRQRVSQERIAVYQADASQELDFITDVEEQQKQQVPRLKMTISLYASTTGIKWDFADPDLLSGQVVRLQFYSFLVLVPFIIVSVL